METSTLEKKNSTSARMRDIVLDITWSKIAQRYFSDKSVPWFYNKMRGVDGNGGEGDFTFEERIRLRNALIDFSERVRKTADSIV
jgi:hypothetical protein